MELQERINSSDALSPAKRLACLRNSDSILNLQTELYRLEDEEKLLSKKKKTSELEKIKKEKDNIAQQLSKELDNYDNAKCNDVKLSNMDKLRYDNIKSTNFVSLVFMAAIGGVLLLFLILSFGYETFLFITTSINHYTFIGYISIFMFVLFFLVMILKHD